MNGQGVLRFATKAFTEAVYAVIDKRANTSAATIPIALHEALNKNIIKRGDIILFVAFGAGLSLGAVLLEW